jgi:hypothetical protein
VEPAVFLINLIFNGHNHFSSGILKVVKSRRLQWAGHTACMGETRNIYRMFVGKHLGQQTLGRLTRRLENNSRIDVRDNSCED